MKYKVGDIVWIELDPKICWYCGPAKIVEVIDQLMFDYFVKLPITMSTRWGTVEDCFIKEKEIKYLVESG